MEATGGLTIPAGGMGGSWIVKLPSARFAAVPENEYAMMALARGVGIEVPENRLIDIASNQRSARRGPSVGRQGARRAALRPRGGRRAVHMEDFAQVFGLYPDDKYTSAATRTSPQCCGRKPAKPAPIEFFRRLVFSVLIGNADMHLKNWSLLYPDRRTPVLSPAYDFVATLPYIPNDTLALSFGGSRSLSEITTDQMRRFADTARIPASPLWKIAVETAERAAESWKSLEQADALPKDLKDSIGKQILGVAANVK